MAFGFNQINNPTPATATWIFRVVLYVCLLGNIAVGGFTRLPADTKLTIVELSSFLTLAIHAASKMFGVDLPGDAQISAKDVSSLKNDNSTS